MIAGEAVHLDIAGQHNFQIIELRRKAGDFHMLGGQPYMKRVRVGPESHVDDEETGQSDPQPGGDMLPVRPDAAFEPDGSNAQYIDAQKPGQQLHHHDKSQPEGIDESIILPLQMGLEVEEVIEIPGGAGEQNQQRKDIEKNDDRQRDQGGFCSGNA